MRCVRVAHVNKAARQQAHVGQASKHTFSRIFRLSHDADFGVEIMVDALCAFYLSRTNTPTIDGDNAERVNVWNIQYCYGSTCVLSTQSRRNTDALMLLSLIAADKLRAVLMDNTICAAGKLREWSESRLIVELELIESMRAIRRTTTHFNSRL